MFWRSIVGVCIAIGLFAGAAGAQGERRLELHVIDSVSGAPIDRADVRVLRTVKDVTGWMIQGRTDSSGRAVIVVPADEQLIMTVRRLGFASSMASVQPSDSDDVLVLALAPAVPTLAPVVTTAEPSSRLLNEAGFYERRRVRPGTFLDSAAITNKKPIDFLSVVRPYLKGCTMIYVDGLPMIALRDVDVRQVIGIEVYASNLQAPPEFPNPLDSEHRCNTILVWRRL